MSFGAEPELIKQENLARLHVLEEGYTPNETTRKENGNKTFTSLSAPFGSGKTVIGDAVVRIFPEIKLINTSTTRRSKPEDQPGFKTADHGITTSWFLHKAEEGALTNFSVIPGIDVYGTLAEDFPGEFNIGPFLPSGLEQIKRGGFKNFYPIYIVTPGDLWREFVNKSRRGLPENKFQLRAAESVDSTEYALAHPEDFIFVENSIEGPEGIEKIARTIGNISLWGSKENTLSPDQAKVYLKDMKAVAEDLAIH